MNWQAWVVVGAWFSLAIGAALVLVRERKGRGRGR